MSDKVNLQKKIDALQRRLSQLHQFGYTEEAIIRTEDLDKLKLTLADIELEELLAAVKSKPKKRRRKKKVVKPEEVVEEVEVVD